MEKNLVTVIVNCNGSFIIIIRDKIYFQIFLLGTPAAPRVVRPNPLPIHVDCEYGTTRPAKKKLVHSITQQQYHFCCESSTKAIISCCHHHLFGTTLATTVTPKTSWTLWNGRSSTTTSYLCHRCLSSMDPPFTPPQMGQHRKLLVVVVVSAFVVINSLIVACRRNGPIFSSQCFGRASHNVEDANLETNITEDGNSTTMMQTQSPVPCSSC